MESHFKTHFRKSTSILKPKLLEGLQQTTALTYYESISQLCKPDFYTGCLNLKFGGWSGIPKVLMSKLENSNFHTIFIARYALQVTKKQEIFLSTGRLENGGLKVTFNKWNNILDNDMLIMNISSVLREDLS